jgi:hypothetical protein
VMSVTRIRLFEGFLASGNKASQRCGGKRDPLLEHTR